MIPGLRRRTRGPSSNGTKFWCFPGSWRFCASRRALICLATIGRERPLEAPGNDNRLRAGREPFGPSTRPEIPLFPREQRVSPDRPAAVQGAKRRSVPLTARTDPGSSRARGKGGGCRRDWRTGAFGASESSGETFSQRLHRRDPGAPPVDGQPRCEARLLHPLDRSEGQGQPPGLQEPS